MPDIQLTCVSAEEGRYRYFRIDDQAAEHLYTLLRDFWTNRPNQDDAQIRERIEEYRASNTRVGIESLQEKVSALIRAQAPDQPFSMIDLGGANGSIYYFIKDRFPTDDIRYLLVEPFMPFVEDFRRAHPEQEAVRADAEEFCSFDDSTLRQRHYSVFFASLVFCMIKPAVAADAIKKAATLTDDIVLWDIMDNASGELEPDQPVIFDFLPEYQQWYFAHHFRRYFEDVGFEIVSTVPTTQTGPHPRKGWATLHARRTD